MPGNYFWLEDRRNLGLAEYLGLMSIEKINQSVKRAHFPNGANRREGVPMPA